MASAEGGELPEDIICLILLRLPDLKWLLSLKLVSKSWYKLISSQSFAAEHYKKHEGRSGNSLLSFLIVRINASNMDVNVKNFFTLMSLDPAAGDLKSSLKKKNIYMPYLDCKNENPYTDPLLFEAGFGVYCIFDFFTNKVAMWNPSMRELKILPPSPFYSVIEVKPPEHRQHICGFGHVQYDIGNINYKVGRLIVRNETNQNYFSIELYSSTTNAWTLFSDCYQVEDNNITYRSGEVYRFVDGTNLNGRFHWFSWFDDRDPHFVSFDYNSEKIVRVEAPIELLKGRRRYIFGISRTTKFDNRFLCLVIFWFGERRTQYYDVWVMREYGIPSSWTMEYTVGPIPKIMAPLGFWNSASGIFFQDYGDGNRLYLCDCFSSHMEKLDIGSDEYEGMTVLEYTESRVSLNGSPDQVQTES